MSATIQTQATAATGQTICLINDNSAVKTDDEVWVLFVGNPANVTASGSAISGLRNLAIPTGSVSTAQVALATTVQSDSFTNPTATMPAVPFPLLFISGANASSQVQVSAYDAATGSFTVCSDPTLQTPNWPLQAQLAGDQFQIGAYSQRLSSLPLSGTTQSTLSGLSPHVYTVNAQALDAAVIYLSYGQLTYISSAPAIASSTITFQTVELTTGTAGGATTSDLTVIDYFGIPLQIQSVDQVGGTATDTRTFYTSQATIASSLTDIGATLSNNALYLGPGQVAANNKGSPSPFPSFESYLLSLCKSQTSFSIAGTSNYGTPNPTVVYGIAVGGNYQSSYNYGVRVYALPGQNFSAVMKPAATGNSLSNAPAYFPSTDDIQDITIHLPLQTSSNPVGYDSVIYGAVLDASTFTIDLTSASSLTPPTLSGPFTVTSGTSTSVFTAASLAQLSMAQLAGLTVQFTSGANIGCPTTIASVVAPGQVALTAPLTAVPAASDQFQILFTVTSASTQNTSRFLGCAPLTGLNFLAPFAISFTSGSNANQQSQVVAIDAAGNLTLGKALANTPQAGDLFAIAVAQTDVFTQLYTNSAFSWAVADVLAGLNFGFPGGCVTGGSQQWYGGFVQAYPFGMARAPNDGDYNPWAALFYNCSDAYGFAFSDRVAPSPLMSTDPGTQNFCITVLPQTQLDAPLVTATATDSAMALSWTPQKGIIYTVTTLPPLAPSQIAIQSAQGTATLSKLPAGTPYQIQVLGSNATQTSLVLPVYASTTGALQATSGPVPFGFSFTWAGTGSLPAQYAVLLNGSPLSLSGNPAATSSNLAASASAGSNLYVLDFQDTSNDNVSVYQAVVVLNVSIVSYVPQTDQPNTFAVDGTVSLIGSSGSLTLAPAGPTYVITYNASSTTSPLVLSIDFAPQVRKKFAAVVAG